RTFGPASASRKSIGRHGPGGTRVPLSPKSPDATGTSRWSPPRPRSRSTGTGAACARHSAWAEPGERRSRFRRSRHAWPARGACSVMLDGEPVRACLMYAVQAHGHRVTTVEGLAKPDGSMSVLQDSFCEAHGLQCGYCTPGMLIAAQGLLNTNPDPTEAQIRDAIGGNLCRCTGYQQIVEAVQLAAKRTAEEAK